MLVYVPASEAQYRECDGNSAWRGPSTWAGRFELVNAQGRRTDTDVITEPSLVTLVYFLPDVCTRWT